ncbi:MAG TPA: deoxynucleoside kinase [Bacteroidota bacterium]|nr:deoxynucleoside kinase [Bacteroidota bacterium]
MSPQEPLQSLIAQTNLRYIAVEGCIGAGKTTLARMLGETLGAQVVLERFEENPFLRDFYRDPERYAFQTQIFFLLTRYKQQQELMQADLFHRFLITDYIFEKDKIFAYLNLQDEELKLYETLVSSIQHSIVAPDIVIYLQSTVPRLLQNIKQRNRSYESEMPKDYIRDLNEAYNYFFFRYRATPLLIVNGAEMDFVAEQSQYEDLLRAIFRPNRAAVEYYNPPTLTKS